MPAAKKPTQKILRVRLTDTDVHPLLEQLAMIADGIAYLKDSRDADPDYLTEREAWETQFEASLKKDGIKTPLRGVKAGKRWHIADGRHRRSYGLKVGLETAPLIQITEAEAREEILRAN